MIRDKDLNIYVKNPHIFGHLLGYKDLIDLHSKWIVDAWLSKDCKALQAHRNSFKTTSILIVGTIWYLLFYNPNATVLIVRKAETDARKIVLTIRNHFESDLILTFVKCIYGVTELSTSNWSSASLTLSIKASKTPEGNVEAKGTTSAITGSHYDFIMPDDIITLRDRVSKAERDWIKLFVRELANIKKEDKNCKIFYSGTPWHKEDAWAILPKPVKYPIGSVSIPGYYKKDLKEKKKELLRITTKSLYDANYELKHTVSEDLDFSDPLYASWPEKVKKITAYLDPSYTGKNTTALAMYATFQNKHFVRGWVWPNDITELYTKIVNILNMWNCGTLYVESNADKGYSARDIRLKYPAVIERHESMNKHVKIISFLKKNWSNIFFADDCQLTFLNQILDYQEGEEPDDAPDALSALLREMKLTGHADLFNRFGIKV